MGDCYGGDYPTRRHPKKGCREKVPGLVRGRGKSHEIRWQVQRRSCNAPPPASRQKPNHSRHFGVLGSGATLDRTKKSRPMFPPVSITQTPLDGIQSAARAEHSTHPPAGCRPCATGHCADSSTPPSRHLHPPLDTGVSSASHANRAFPHRPNTGITTHLNPHHIPCASPPPPRRETLRLTTQREESPQTAEIHCTAPRSFPRHRRADRPQAAKHPERESTPDPLSHSLPSVVPREGWRPFTSGALSTGGEGYFLRL